MKFVGLRRNSGVLLDNSTAFVLNALTFSTRKKNGTFVSLFSLNIHYFFKNVGILIDCSFTELCGVLGTCNVGTVPVGLDCTVVFG